MIFGVPAGELAFIAIAVIVGGVVTGLLAGLFGIGGGAVIVPVLYEVFRVVGAPEDIRFQLCVGTSLAVIVPTTVRSYLAHRAKGAVVAGVLRLWTMPAIAGVAAGSFAAAFAPAAVFKLAFVLVASLLAVKLLFGRDSWRLGAELPGRVAMTGYGFLVGLASSLMGVSGGSVSNAILTLYARPIHNAVATSAGLGVPVTIAGTIGYMAAGLSHQAQLPPFSIGFVSLIGLVLMAPISTLVAPIGVHLAHALPKRQLEIAFGIFLLLVSLRFIATLIL
jgi:uncharacterized membrane protein YfcA